MAVVKTNKSADTERDPADPIGMPPGGGSWTWDISKQQWIENGVPVVLHIPIPAIEN